MGNVNAGTNRVTGLAWENRFSWACKEQKVTAFKIPLGARQVSATKLLRVQTPFDWVLAKDGVAAVIDTKRCEAKTLTKARITPHQAIALKEAFDAKIVAGYVVWFTECDLVVYFNADKLMRALKGQSLYPTAGLRLGKHDNFDLNILLASSQADKAASC